MAGAVSSHASLPWPSLPMARRSAAQRGSSRAGDEGRVPGSVTRTGASCALECHRLGGQPPVATVGERSAWSGLSRSDLPLAAARSYVKRGGPSGSRAALRMTRCVI
jgi:hypothetical protein